MIIFLLLWHIFCSGNVRAFNSVREKGNKNGKMKANKTLVGGSQEKMENLSQKYLFKFSLYFFIFVSLLVNLLEPDDIRTELDVYEKTSGKMKTQNAKFAFMAFLSSIPRLAVSTFLQIGDKFNFFSEFCAVCFTCYLHPSSTSTLAREPLDVFFFFDFHFSFVSYDLIY